MVSKMVQMSGRRRIGSEGHIEVTIMSKFDGIKSAGTREMRSSVTHADAANFSHVLGAFAFWVLRSRSMIKGSNFLPSKSSIMINSCAMRDIRNKARQPLIKCAMEWTWMPTDEVFSFVMSCLDKPVFCIQILLGWRSNFFIETTKRQHIFSFEGWIQQ